MKDHFKNHWEKIFVVLATGFMISSWFLSQSIKNEAIEIQAQGQRVLRGLHLQEDDQEIDMKAEVPQLDKKILDYLSFSQTGIYAIPTGPSSGFETLPPVKLSENDTKELLLRFSDPQIAEAFQGKLNDPRVTIRLSDPNIVACEVLDGRRIRITGLKYGTATLSIRDRSLKGVKMEIEVEQTIQLKGWYLPETFTAQADEENLNRVQLSWQKGLFSHASLGGVESYILERQDLSGAVDPETASWQPLIQWSNEEAPSEYDDNSVVPEGQYRYRLQIQFAVMDQIEKGRDYPINPDFPFNHANSFPLQKSESRFYNPSQIISIRTGIKLLGFTRVLDPGGIYENKSKNTLAQAAIKKWHNGHWVMAAVKLNPLRNKYIQIPRDALEKELLPLVGKSVKYFKDPTQKDQKTDIDFFTDYALFNIDFHEAGETIDFKNFIPKEELERISDDGQHYKSDVRSFWILKTDDPYFSGEARLPQTRIILYSNSSLQDLVDRNNQTIREKIIAQEEAERQAQEEALKQSSEEETEASEDDGSSQEETSLQNEN